jgi:hypothetical protein
MARLLSAIAGVGVALALVAAGKAAIDKMHDDEAAAVRWRWEHITGPAMETCRKRGGIANLDGWGKVYCDR